MLAGAAFGLAGDLALAFGAATALVFFGAFSCFFLGAATLLLVATAGFLATFFVGEADRFRLFSLVLALLVVVVACFFLVVR